MKTTSETKPLNVLFLCTGNSARSIMAEAILNRLGKGKFQASSAGSHPAGAINPLALNLLRKTNYDVSNLRSKSWDEFATDEAPKLDFVFTVCDNAANEVCPIWPGQPMTAHWGLPDPAKAEGNDAERAFAFDDCFRMLTQRISIFVNLPIESLSKLSLQHHLDEIGRVRREAPSEAPV
jgi:arsenate reductase (thioredoxin)